MTTPPDISALDQAAAAFRAALLRRDEAALKRLMAAYQPAYTRIQARVAAITAEIAQLRADGATINVSWLFERELEQRRLDLLQRQILAEWAKFGTIAESIITEAQQQAVVAALIETQQLTLAALNDAGVVGIGADVARLNTAAMTELVGTLADGSPLKTLLDALGQQAAQDVGDALKHAVAVGRSPRQTAKDIRAALGGNLNRALTIARTEQMRAYRTASLESYKANSDLLRGWQWRASPSRRTCPVCLAMDGTEHPLDEPMASHPNCRCTPIPILRSRPTPERETGAKWFDRQPAAVQRDLLGKGKYELYRDDKLTLADLVGVRSDSQWGRTLYERTLAQVATKRS